MNRLKAENQALRQQVSPDQELADKLKRCHADHDQTIEAFNRINEQHHRLIEEKGELRRELEQAREDLEKVRSHQPTADIQLPILLDELRSRTLADLKLGKQAPGYKSAQKALDIFIQKLGGESEKL